MVEGRGWQNNYKTTQNDKKKTTVIPGLFKSINGKQQIEKWLFMEKPAKLG